MARVLCIEDEPDFREDIVEYLRLQAYEVDEAADGTAALAMLREQDYDLVICDIMMPGMDGFSVLKEHRSHLADQPAMSDVPFVFLTALSDVHDQIAARNLGCDDFLAKPIDLKLLSATVENRIARHAQMRIERELAQHESVSAMQAVYAHELMQPAIQLYEVAQYIGGLPRDDLGIKKLDMFLPRLQELAKRQLTSIEILREIENLHQEHAPRQVVQLNAQWLDETGRHLRQRIAGITLDMQCRTQADCRVIGEPAWILRALYFIADSMCKARSDTPLTCALEQSGDYLHVHLAYLQQDEAALSPAMSVQTCLIDRSWRRAMNAHWGALHYADAVMRKQGGFAQFQLSSTGLMHVMLSLPHAKMH